VDELREYAHSRGDGFRHVLTPYVGMESAIAVVTWEWTYIAECVDSAPIDEFLDAHYLQAPENVVGDGRYDSGWIGR
jgi:hypothetical protein